MGSASSGDAIRSITDWAATPRSSSSLGSRKPTEDFGSLTFNEEVQRARLPKEVFRSLRRAIAHGEPIDHSVADIIASALRADFDDDVRAALRERVSALADRFPLYPNLDSAGAR